MKGDTDRKYLAVYGTLRPGLGTPMGRWLSQRTEYVGSGYVFGHLFDLGTYPGLLIDDAVDTKVTVDLFAYFQHQEQDLFLKLDQYEGISDLPINDEYKRIMTKVYTAHGQLSGWVYVLNGNLSSYVDKKRIWSGDYCTYQNMP